MYDVIIIGTGVAGLTAGMYTARRGLSTLLLGADLGGQTASTAEIENYPGIGRIEGPELVRCFLEQARMFGCTVQFEVVTGLEKTDDGFCVQTLGTSYTAHAVILASGKSPRKLSVPGEQEFFGKGVSYNPIADATLYTGRDVAVIGGGNSAVQAAGILAEHAQRVYLIHRRGEFRAEQVLLDRLTEKKNVEYVLDTAVSAVRGVDEVTSLIVENCATNESREISVAAVFAAIGFEPQPGIYKDCVEVNASGHIVISEKCETSCPGVFAAGDSTTIPYQQIVISAGEGAKAALSAYAYVQQKKGLRALKVDWGFVG